MRAFKYGDNIDTDIIVPGKYLSLTEPEELALVCMEGIDPCFPEKVKKGDIIVAGRNFGSGSSREHAPISIKAAGISCVIASSFARIFFRNAINVGLPVLEAPAAAEKINDGDELEIDFKDGIIRDITTNDTFCFVQYSDSVEAIIKAGGLINYIRNKEEQ